MKKLTIKTQLYSRQVEDFVARLPRNCEFICKYSGWKGNIFTINCLYDPVNVTFVSELATLLTDIALYENPVFRHSPKLQDLARDLKDTEVYASLLKSLEQYIKQNQVLNIEGYIIFRMSKYREKLDMMSYSLIKKMKLIQGD